MKNRKYFAMLALLGALSLVAAACSDDGGGDDRWQRRHVRHGRGGGLCIR